MNNDHQPTVQLVAISGSIRRASNCTAVLRSLQPLLPAGVTLHIAPLDAIPPYNADLDGDAPPEPVAALKRAIAAADGLVLCSPEYNYGMPGVLKNAIDWASRPYGENAWSGKPVALMSAALSMGGGVRAQYQLRQAFVFLNMEAVIQPEVAISNAPERFDKEGNLSDETSKKLIGQLLRNLVDKVRLQRLAPLKAAA